MYEKWKNGAECERYKKFNINLTKIQRSNERVSQGKNLLKGIMIVFKIRCIPHWSFGLSQCKSSGKKKKKKHAGWQNLSKDTFKF